jgi:hypothetical protein
MKGRYNLLTGNHARLGVHDVRNLQLLPYFCLASLPCYADSSTVLLLSFCAACFMSLRLWRLLQQRAKQAP